MRNLLPLRPGRLITTTTKIQILFQQPQLTETKDQTNDLFGSPLTGLRKTVRL